MAVIEFEFKIDTESKDDLDFVTQAIRLMNNVDIISDDGINFDHKPNVAFSIYSGMFSIKYRIPEDKVLTIKSREDKNE